MKKILITAPVHQDAKIFREYLWSLDRLNIPNGYEIHKYFYLHNTGNLKKFLQPNEYECINDNVQREKSDITHIWNQENFSIVSKMRTMALEKARKEKYDYIFSVDSDTILHKQTLKELLECNVDFISKLHWTQWIKNNPESIGPNCYDGINAKGQKFYFEPIERFNTPNIYEIGTAGGCNLISSNIFNNELINYYPIKILKSSFWEDFAFSTRCKCVIPNLKFWLDTRNPVRHLYREEDYNKWIKEEKEEWIKEF